MALFRASAKAELGSNEAAAGGGTLLNAIASAIINTCERRRNNGQQRILGHTRAHRKTRVFALAGQRIIRDATSSPASSRFPIWRWHIGKREGSREHRGREHRVQIYSNQKEIKYISPSNIRASVEIRPPQLHNLLQFSPALPSLTFYGPPPSASRGSAIHVFAVYCNAPEFNDNIATNKFWRRYFHKES